MKIGNDIDIQIINSTYNKLKAPHINKDGVPVCEVDEKEDYTLSTLKIEKNYFSDRGELASIDEISTDLKFLEEELEKMKSKGSTSLKRRR